MAEARVLLELMTCGKKAGYSVLGNYSCHDKETYQPKKGSYTIVSWLPARFSRERQSGEPDLPKQVEEPRPLTAHVVANHLAGKGWVGAAPPSWLSWFCLDIDLPKVGPKGALLSLEEAEQKRDEVLSLVWDALEFNEERMPVILQTPGNGYHLYVPLSRKEGEKKSTWPAHVIRNTVAGRLGDSGIQLRDGYLELWPAGKVLRFPMGRQMVTVHWDKKLDHFDHL